MAKFVNPFGGSSGGGSSPAPTPSFDVQELAAQSGVPVDRPKKGFNFTSLLDLLNKPSEMTESFLTGGSKYDKRLNEMGIQNTEGKLDLNDVLSTTGRLVADPLNLIAPLKLGKFGLKGASFAGKIATKVKPIAKAAKVAEELLVPGAKLARVSPELAKALPALQTATRAKQAQAVRKTAETFKEFSPAIRDNLGKLVEAAGKGAKLAPDEMAAVEKAKRFISSAITNPEKAAGVLPAEIANYFPRKADREAVEGLLKFGGSRLSLSLGGAEKGRKFVTQEAGEKAGVVYKNALEALGIRASKSEAARANSGFIKQLIDGEIKDVNGESLIAAVGKSTAPGYSEFSLKGLKGFQAPTEAVKEIEKYYQTFISDDATNALLKFYDKALGKWKGSVTSVFPAFHMRNMIGNLSNMYLGGFVNPLNPLSVAKATKRIGQAAELQRGKEVVVGGQKLTGDLLEQLGIMGKGQFGEDVPEVLSSVLKNAPGYKKIASKIDPFNVGKNIGGAVEDNARVAFFVDRIAKGDDIKRAVAQTNKYLFDYGSLTDFERGFMRRIIPFYTWTRKNIPLQVETLITNPGKQAAITKTYRNLFPLTEEQEGVLPPWFQDTMVGAMPGSQTEEGDFSTLSNVGLPIEDLGRLTPREGVGRAVEQELVAKSGPLGNLLGTVMNRDPFRGVSLDDPALPYSYGKEAMGYKGKLPQAFMDWLEYKEETTKSGKVTARVDPKKFQYIKSLLGRGLRTTSKPEAAFKPGTVTDFNLDIEKEKQQERWDKELEQALLDNGTLKEFKRTYVPGGTGEGSGRKAASKFVNPF